MKWFACFVLLVCCATPSGAQEIMPGVWTWWTETQHGCVLPTGLGLAESGWASEAGSVRAYATAETWGDTYTSVGHATADIDVRAYVAWEVPQDGAIFIRYRQKSSAYGEWLGISSPPTDLGWAYTTLYARHLGSLAWEDCSPYTNGTFLCGKGRWPECGENPIIDESTDWGPYVLSYPIYVQAGAGWQDDAAGLRPRAYASRYVPGGTGSHYGALCNTVVEESNDLYYCPVEP